DVCSSDLTTPKNFSSSPCTSSGSSRCESCVYPQTSTNSTVTGRRSASPLPGAIAGDDDASGAPQPPQNFSPGRLPKPHAVHFRGSKPPHSAQKRRDERLPAPQFAHVT